MHPALGQVGEDEDESGLQARSGRIDWDDFRRWWTTRVAKDIKNL